MAQNDTHVALIILTTQMWGGGGLLVEKTFSGQNLCSCAFGANIHSYTKQRARHGTPFLQPPPLLRRASMSPPPPPRRAIFRSPWGEGRGGSRAAAGRPPWGLSSPVRLVQRHVLSVAAGMSPVPVAGATRFMDVAGGGNGGVTVSTTCCLAPMPCFVWPTGAPLPSAPEGAQAIAGAHKRRTAQKRRKKIGSSVAYKTRGKFLSQSMGQEDGHGKDTDK